MSGLFAIEATAEADLITFRELLTADHVSYNARAKKLGKSEGLTGTPPGLQRLLSSTAGAYTHDLPCMQPRLAKERRYLENQLLNLKLKKGRFCQHELCRNDACGLHVREQVLLPSEAKLIIEHGDSVLRAEDAANPRPSAGGLGAYSPSRRVDFSESARFGSRDGHLLLLRAAERMRRISLDIFGLPSQHLRISEHFLALRQPGPTIESSVHCDEAVYPLGESARAKWRFHFSAVVVR
jgi:hypothetical protein